MTSRIAKTFCRHFVESSLFQRQNKEVIANIFQIILCETDGLDDIIPNCGRTVAVRTGSKDPNNTISGTTATNSLREVRFLASLSDLNIARILGE